MGGLHLFDHQPLNLDASLIILVTGLADIFYFLLSTYISNTVDVSNIIFKPYIYFRFNTIFLGLLILAIAQIFVKGSEMKTEQDLTI